MRWIRFEHEGRQSYGILHGEGGDAEVEAVEGSPFGEHRATGTRMPFPAVKLLVPVIPPTFYAAGLNYVEHASTYAETVGSAPNIPQKADVGYRAANALIPHEAPVIIPRDAGEQVHYEGELVVVIGKEAKHLSEEEALSCVFGYTIGNDVSERDWQNEDRTMWRAKNTDTFKPMGPWIETDLDLDAARTSVRLNGETTVEFKTNDMLFGIETFISAMSRYLTLHPGDILWMGTEGKSPNMKDGDEVEIEISGIGTLRNRFQKEA